MGAAEHKAARQSWRKRLNMVMVDDLFVRFSVDFGSLDIIVDVERKSDGLTAAG